MFFSPFPSDLFGFRVCPFISELVQYHQVYLFQSFCAPLADEFLCDNVTPLKWNLPATLHFQKRKIPRHALSVVTDMPPSWLHRFCQLLPAQKATCPPRLSYIFLFAHFPLTCTPGCFSMPVQELYPVRPSPTLIPLVGSEFCLLWPIGVFNSTSVPAGTVWNLESPQRHGGCVVCRPLVLPRQCSRESQVGKTEKK